MPLSHGKSKKAFEHNVKAEYEAGKPLKQSLAIAYSVKRKGKKMAKGGPVSAKAEKRPMPEERDNDSMDVTQNSGDKPAKQDNVLDQPTVKQAQANERPGKQSIKHPKIMKGGTFTTKLRDQEDDLEMHDAPASPMEQPAKEYDEESPDRQGPKVAALEMKKMAQGGVAMEMGKGPEEDKVEHPEGLESDDDMEGPPEKEFMAGHFAEGGMLHDEIEEEHHDSIASAIMARKDREKAMHGADNDSDIEQMLAEGGEINGKDSIYPSKSSQSDLSRNAEEDANMEDQSSYDALRKENYSESAGLKQLDSPMDSGEHGHELSDEDAHDMISSIRRKIAQKRQFGR